MGKLVYGVGVNDADYAVTTKVSGKEIRCAYYSTWTSMLSRGYYGKLKTRWPTYQDVSVCEEWHTFSTFKTWMEQQPWEGMQLDKDVLIPRNKVYRPEACVFVPGRVNNLLTSSGAIRGEYPVGVCYLKRGADMVNEYKKPYRARVKNGAGKHKYLGCFLTPEEAHKAWQLAKADVIEETVEWWHTDEAVKHSFHAGAAEALIARAARLREDAMNGVETTEL